MNDSALLDAPGTAFVAVYLLTLLVVGWWGRRARREASLRDFYLAGHTLSLPVLFLTLYATQYSGNNLLGFAGAAYRNGFAFLVSVTFMMGIVAVYWLFAPPLHRLAHRHGYITPGDFLQHRYGSVRLVLLVNLIFVVVLATYIITNLKAIGYVVEVATGGTLSFAQGIIALALIMVVYESLGGLRSVAWTDAIQGVLLFLGGLLVVGVLAWHSHGFADLIDGLRQTRPEFWVAPTLDDQVRWSSVMLLVAFGAAVYPQALQRIFAASNTRALRRALQLLVFMPLLTTLFAVVVGLSGAALFPDLSRLESEAVALRVIAYLEDLYPQLAFLLAVFIAAVIAAIMSTVDSALLTISSIVTQDFYRPLAPGTDQRRLTLVGKLFSWGLMAALVALAIDLPQTIWRLTQLKLELLIQAAPAILLATAPRAPPAKAVMLGVGVGVLVTLALKFGGDWGFAWSDKPLHVHAGLWGAAANLAIVLLWPIKPVRKGYGYIPQKRSDAPR